MTLTDEEKRRRKVQRTLERFKELRLGTCINQTALLFQKLVKLRALRPDGKLTCCSCGRRDYPGKHFHGGHWIGRSKKAVIFDPRNCHPQCALCNKFGLGAVKANYDEFMRRTYGQEVMDELKRLGNTTKQWTKDELAELYVGYREEINEIEKTRRFLSF